MRRRFLALGLMVLVSLNLSDICPSHAVSLLSDEAIENKIKESQVYYQKKMKSIEDQVNQMFSINYSEAKKEFEGTLNELNMKMSIIEKIENPIEKSAKIEELKSEYQNEKLYKYIEANSYFENELERDHEFVGGLLQRLEDILEMISQKDPVFKHAFFSPEFKNQYGLVLKRVVWSSTTLKNVSAETAPINVHSVFGDKTKIPAIIKFTPIAFFSSAFLRSIVIHELNHACFYKDPQFSDVTQFSGGATQKAEGDNTHYFKSLNPFNPSYQYHLIHEYYSFKTQLIWDEKTDNTSFFRLDPANKKNTENMLEWTYSQLNEENKQFIKNNPDPPIMKIINKYYK